MTKIRMRCAKCHSTNCGRDGAATWDIEKQDWVLSSTHDSSWCDDCGKDDPGLVEAEIGSFTVEHIDDCYPDALTDHHNREGECLIGVPLDATTTAQQVFDALYGEAVDAELPEGVSAEQIGEACSKEVFGVLTPSDVWNSELEASDNGLLQAWFVLRWEV